MAASRYLYTSRLHEQQPTGHSLLPQHVVIGGPPGGLIKKLRDFEVNLGTCRFRPMTLVRAQRRMKTDYLGRDSTSRTVIISCSGINFYAAGYIAGAIICELGVLVLVHNGPVPSVLLCRGAYDGSCNQRPAKVAQQASAVLASLICAFASSVAFPFAVLPISSTVHLRVFTILSRFHDFLFL